ncbi:MAG TPA: FAD-binding oxidoreductase [Dehalococcoidia bacterium]|nr:FAD-binding oxidoreductase [Dehalococcoidia bacterium]
MTSVTQDTLRERTHGLVISAEDSQYDSARAVYNAMIDRKPSVVIQAADVTDVIAGVEYARESGLDLSVRGGAHSVPGFGTCDGGVVIDLVNMNGVRVDPERKTARAAGGCTWARFNHATYSFGLATTGGIVGSTGVGGLTLGGGIGYLTRRYGLTIDNLLSADVVTADGRVVVASANENEDLFWAIRGGSGNFGVVTSFEFQLHPVKDIVAGIFFYPVDKTPDVLSFFRTYIDEAPEAMGAFPSFHIAPPLPFIPEDEVGKPFCAVVACWSGPVEEGEQQMSAFREPSPAVAEMVAPMPYYAMNTLFDPLLPPGLQHYWKTVFAEELTDEAIAAHVEHGPKVPAVNSAVHLYPINGAAARVPADYTAFSFRGAKFATVLAGMWPDPADNEKNVAWVKDYHAALSLHSMSGGYVNFMAEDDEDKARENYGSNYERLASIKKAWDPNNLFHMNQNIKP